MTEPPQRFVCIDCGCPTFLFAVGKRVPARCGICQTIAQVADRGEREALRARLYDAESMAHWQRNGGPARCD
jgi:hypothetical protein